MPSDESPPLSALRIGGHVHVRGSDGPLEVEAVLFAAGPVRAPTTARDARGRLARSSLTATATEDAAAAFSRETLSSYARADCVRRVLSLLGPVELFQGRTYHRASQSYEGMWLDLRALANDLGARGAGLALQGVHLVALLDEVDPEVPLVLENGGSGEAARIAFLRPQTSIAALRALRARPPRARWDEEDAVRGEIARSLRDRLTTTSTPAKRARLQAIERELAALDRPAAGLLSHPDVWTLERQLEAGDPRGARERIEALPQAAADPLAVRYLRARLALLDGSEPALRLAERLLAERSRSGPFRELELLKARAWKEAGNWSYAKYFARRLVEDVETPDGLALAAHELLEEANARAAPSVPSPPEPPSEPSPATMPLPNAPPRRYSSPMPIPESWPDLSGQIEPEIIAARIVVVEGPSSDRIVIPSSVPEIIEAPAPDTIRSVDQDYDSVGDHQAPPLLDSEPSAALVRGHVTARPPAMVPRSHVVVASPTLSEEVETLSLPPGLSETQLVEGTPARTIDDVRIVSTRLSRTLARDYRLLYGVQLRTDPSAIEWMQRHLLTLAGTKSVDSPELAWELRRHGAFLSEILARMLGGYWVDVGPSELGYWAMFVPPRTRTWPFGRVHRFVALGHREKDLVSYYLDLVERARGD